MTHESAKWRCEWSVAKYAGDFTGDQINAGDVDHALYDLIEVEGNMLVIGGASVLWRRLIGTDQTAFDGTNAAIAVGSSTTTEGLTNTALVTELGRKVMDNTFPSHTHSLTNSAAQTITFKSTFLSAEANGAWNEWGIVNSTTSGSGVLLNRKVATNLGTKGTGATWQFTVTLSLA